MNIIKEIEGEPTICIIVSDGELDVVNCGCRAIMGRLCARMYVGFGSSGAIHAYLDHVLTSPTRPQTSAWKRLVFSLSLHSDLCDVFASRRAGSGEP